MVVDPIQSTPRGPFKHLLDEEDRMWSKDLCWNFGPTRQRLENALREGTLRGLVARDEVGPCAYATYAVDEDQGVLGSCFAAERARGLGYEARLARQVLDRLVAHRPRVIDSQTLFSSDRELMEPFTARGFQSVARLFMSVEQSAWVAPRPEAPFELRTRPTHRTDLRAVSHLIYEAHHETRNLDASSSFDTLHCCERVLRQIVLDEVCGPFDSMGSRRVEAGGRAVAVSLLTWPLQGVAHVSEVATAPSHRRLGLARRCLTESLRDAFERGRARCATLSVTASNRAAIALYESLGFKTRVRYGSHVLREVPLS